jgi:hypothetical protein
MSQLYYNLTILNTSSNWQILEYEYSLYMSGKLLTHEYEFNVHLANCRSWSPQLMADRICNL